MTTVIEGFDQYREEGEQVERLSTSVYKFTLKHQYSIKNNPLCGICLPQWIRILQQRWHQIEWSIYWPRLIFISLLACVNSLLAIPEWFFYSKRIQQTTIHFSPVFILGHPRTGTTLLHSLLALDENQFALCTTFCSGFPSCFLWFERIGKKLFHGVIDEKRPMDNVKLHLDLPQEDELATNVLSAGISPYMPLFFMKQESEFRPYYAFDEAAASRDEALISSKPRQQWMDSFLLLLRKLTLRAQLLQPSGQHRLLLKSPVHTARIPLLISLFPDAQFIYIHRHPYDVFRSAAHMADTTYWYTYMNVPSDELIQEFILRQYEILWDRYQEGRALLRENQIMEVSFDELVRYPKETVSKIYQHFHWDGANTMEMKLETELGEVRAYKPNKHPPLGETLKQIVKERWGASMKQLGYE